MSGLYVYRTCIISSLLTIRCLDLILVVRVEDYDKLYSPQMVVTTKYTVKKTLLRKEKNKTKQNKWHVLV